jgi:hypothetical protein
MIFCFGLYNSSLMVLLSVSLALFSVRASPTRIGTLTDELIKECSDYLDGKGRSSLSYTCKGLTSVIEADMKYLNTPSNSHAEDCAAIYKIWNRLELFESYKEGTKRGDCCNLEEFLCFNVNGERRVALVTIENRPRTSVKPIVNFPPELCKLTHLQIL